MIEMQITGMHSVSVLGTEYKVRQGRCSVCKAARALIDQGFDPEEIVHVMRGDKPSLNPTRLGWFAERETRETVAASVKWVKYQPHPMSETTP